MTRRWQHTKLWVEIVYRLLSWITETCEKLTPKFYWKYKFLDDHCWCERCEERRAEGNQGPLKGSRNQV